MRELTIELTNKCSLDCLFCSTRAGVKGNTFLSVEYIAAMLKKYKRFPLVRLSGGEPFEHPKLEEIIKLLFDERKGIEILSCGVKNQRVIPEELMERIGPSIKGITFSYHGYYAEHERIVCPGKPFHLRFPYWDIMLDSAENANSAKIPISFQTVLIKANYDKLESIAKSMWGFNQIGYLREWHILRFVKQGRGLTNSDQALSEEQVAQLPDVVSALRTRYRINITYTNSYDMSRCDCGSEKAVITYDQQEIPCSALKGGVKARGRFRCIERL